MYHSNPNFPVKATITQVVKKKFPWLYSIMENWYKYKILTLDLGGSREPCYLPAMMGDGEILEVPLSS